MEIRPILPMAIGMLSLTKSLLEFSSDFVYSYFGYLFIFCPEWLLGLLWPSLNVMS